MKNNTDLINKSLSKSIFNYIVYLYTPTTNWFDFSKYVYDVNLDYTDLKIDFTPSTSTAKISFYMPKDTNLCNLIIDAVSNKTLKARVYLDSSPEEKMFEGYIDYPTFEQTFRGFNDNRASIEFFDYTYILKSKKIGRTVIHSGTAQTGSSNTITLSSSASSESDFYNYNMIEIVSGKGISQERVIIDYNGITKEATIDRNWDTIPDNTTVYAIKKKLQYTNIKKCDNTNTNNSLVHRIMDEAGFSASYISVSNIDNIVAFITFEDEITCFDALRNLFQTELMIFDFYTGILRAKSIDTSTITPVASIDNRATMPNFVYGIEEKISNYANNYKSIRATFDSIIVGTEIKTLFSLTDKDSGYENSQIGRYYPCYKYISGGASYPADGNLITATLKFNDTCDVIYADDISIEILTYEGINGRTPCIILSDFQINGGEVKFRIYNNTATGDYLLTLKIKGKPVYIQSSETVVEGDTTEGDSINIENNWFFTNITQLKKLVDFYKYIICDTAKKQYTLKFDFLPQFEIGDIISFNLKSNYNFNGLVMGIEHNLKIDNKASTTIKAIDVDVWTYSSSRVITENYKVNTIPETSGAIEEQITDKLETNTLVAEDVETITFTDEDNDDVILRLKIYINSLGEKYLAIVKVYKDTGTIKEFANLRIKNLELMDGKILANTIANTTEINLRNLDDTDFIGLDAKYYKIQDTEVIKKNTNNEVEADVNKLIATKELVYGADGQSANWITNTTPILRQRDTSNNTYNYLIINTKLIAYGYIGGYQTMYDITLKTYAYGSDIYTDHVLQVRITGYAYSNNTFIRFRAYVQGNNATDLQVIGYVDNTTGEIKFALFSPTFKFSSYYRYSEIYFNNYYYAFKSRVDNWSITYSDTITGYNTTWGIQNAKVQGDVSSYGNWFTLATASLSGASSYERYFRLNKPCIVRVTSSASTESSYFIVGNLIYYGSISSINNISRPIFLGAGKYSIGISFSSTTSTTLTLYAANVQNYSPYSLWDATDICPTGFTTS